MPDVMNDPTMQAMLAQLQAAQQQPSGGAYGRFAPPMGPPGGRPPMPRGDPSLGNGIGPGTPTTGLLSGGPQIPQGAGNNQAFATNFQPTGANAFSRMVQHGLASHKFGGLDRWAQGMQNLPGSFSVGQFNRVAQTDPVGAFQMSAWGGQPYRDAIQSQNGWTNEQFNQWMGDAGGGALPGFTPELLDLIRRSA